MTPIHHDLYLVNCIVATNFCKNSMFNYQNTLNDWFSGLNINQNKDHLNFETFSRMQMFSSIHFHSPQNRLEDRFNIPIGSSTHKVPEDHLSNVCRMFLISGTLCVHWHKPENEMIYKWISYSHFFIERILQIQKFFYQSI